MQVHPDRASLPDMKPLALLVASILVHGSLAHAEPVAAPKPAAPAATSAAVVGKPAPDFTLKDLDGKEVRLSSLKGKTVVLEWFNPGCPFVRKSHEVGSLVDTAKRHTKSGVVWFAINSGAAGKQGADLQANVAAARQWSLPHPILRDETGAVGKAYGATNTPHMFVIDKKGVLVYAGAIDNSPDAERKSPDGGKLVNYVDAALQAVSGGKPVQPATTKPYGCSVKYGS
jgi:peroxiredoxin